MFQVLLKHGADIRAHAYFDDIHKQALLPDFVNPENASHLPTDLAEAREKLAEHAVYRKLIESPEGVKQAKKVLSYDRTHNISFIKEEHNINIKLKDNISLSHLYQDNNFFIESMKHNHILGDVSGGSLHVLDKPISKNHEINDNIFRKMLHENVYDFDFKHAENIVVAYVTMWTYEISGHSSSVSTHEIPIELPISYEGENVIESITYNAVEYTKPIDIAMFLTYGHTFHTLFWRRGIFDYVSTIADSEIFQYIIERGYDPYHDDLLTESTKHTFVAMIARGRDDKVKIFLDRVYHGLLGFFEVCLTTQFYKTARTLLRRVREPFDYHALCRKHLDHVEHLILTNAKDSNIKELAAYECAGEMKTISAVMAVKQSSDVSPINFKILLLACPELVFAFLSFKSDIKEFREKFGEILKFAVEKRDATLLEVLLSARVGIDWPSHLTHEKMQNFAEACVHFKKLRKPFHQQYPDWPKSNQKVPVAQIIPKQDFATSEKRYEISIAINSIHENAAELLGRWTSAHNEFLAKMPDSGWQSYEQGIDMINPEDFLVAAQSQQKVKGYLDSITYPQWHAWFVCAHDVLFLYQRIESNQQVLTTDHMLQVTADKMCKSLARYDMKLSAIDKQINDSISSFHHAIDAYKQSQLNTIQEKNISKVTSHIQSEKDDIGVEQQDHSRKSRYIIMLQSYFNGEYAFLTRVNGKQLINRFFVLLMQIHEQTVDLMLAPKLLPTVRNIYIHYGPFFDYETQVKLIEGIHKVYDAVSSAKSLKVIKQSVFDVIDMAFKQALCVFKEDPATDLTSQFKQKLYDHYSQVNIDVRLGRIFHILQQFDQITCQNLQLKDLTYQEKVQLVYHAAEMGEHLKSSSANDLYRIFGSVQAEGEKFFVSTDLLDLMELRNKLYHVFVDDDFSQITRLKVNDDQAMHAKCAMLEVGMLNESHIEAMRDLWERLKEYFTTKDEVSLKSLSLFSTNTSAQRGNLASAHNTYNEMPPSGLTSLI